MAAQRCWERFRGGKESGDAGTHFSEGVEDAVEDDEEREDFLNGSERAAEDKAEDAPAEEAEGHCLFAAYAVHEEAADYAAGEVEAIHHGLEKVSLAFVKGFFAGIEKGGEWGKRETELTP